MLEVLSIRNIAIIDSAEIQFKKGLNILSGETGAGKSIILEAISVLLGSRLGKQAALDLIRSGCDEGIVQGVFNTRDISWVGPRLERLGFPDHSPELVIKRSLHRNGRNRISINGELATQTTLQKFCEGLIDLCGQHEHQTLLMSDTQLELLDRFGGLIQQTKSLGARWTQYQVLKKKLDQLKNAESQRSQRLSFLNFQIDEIQSAQLKPGEEETLAQEKLLLQSAQSRAHSADQVRSLLEAEDSGVLQILKSAQAKLRPLQNQDSRILSLGEALERAIAETEDVVDGVHRYLGLAENELDPGRLQIAQERLSQLADLKRKYGQSSEEILKYLDRLKSESQDLEGMDGQIETISSELAEEEGKLVKMVRRLSADRSKASQRFSLAVTQELKDLKMGDAKFIAKIDTQGEPADWNSTGADQIEFLVQTNRGEDTKPLRKIASGGELSRLMLAIRRIIADRGGIGVYIFDEIDSGIGGQTAFQVGKKLKSVASYNQVICITHVPQLASFADHHLIVNKTTQGKRTVTEIRTLTDDKRKEELARMLGGPLLTRKSLANASELLELAQSASRK